MNAIVCHGSCFVARRSALEEIGGIPTETITEDWATSIKLQAAGYKLYYFPEFLAYHSADGSHWNYDPKFVYNSYRNKLIFQEKYLPRFTFALWKFVFGVYGEYLARSAVGDEGADATAPPAAGGAL